MHRLATALMTPRPWMRITDPERARTHFEARARHMLATAREPQAVVEHEEREAERLAVTATTNDKPKGHHRG